MFIEIIWSENCISRLCPADANALSNGVVNGREGFLHLVKTSGVMFLTGSLTREGKQKLQSQGLYVRAVEELRIRNRYSPGAR